MRRFCGVVRSYSIKSGDRAVRANRIEAAGLPGDGTGCRADGPGGRLGAHQVDEFVDVIVHRWQGLIERGNESRVQVIKHLDGVCHVYVDDDADLEKAGQLCQCQDATLRHPYMETLLVAQTRARKCCHLSLSISMKLV